MKNKINWAFHRWWITAVIGVIIIGCIAKNATANIVWESESTSYNPFSSQSLSLTKPTGTTSGDLLIVFIALDGASASIVTPLGWTELYQTVYGTDITGYCAYKVATGFEGASYTFDWTPFEKATGIVIRLSGQASSGYINAWNYDSAQTATPTAPSITTDADGCLLIAVCLWDNDNGPRSCEDGDYTEKWEVDVGSGGTSQLGAILEQSSAGSTGTVSFLNYATEQLVSFQLAIEPDSYSAGSETVYRRRRLLSGE